MRYIAVFLCSTACMGGVSAQAYNDAAQHVDVFGWEELVHSEIASIVANRSVTYDQAQNSAASHNFTAPSAGQFFSIGAYNQNSGDNANVSSSISVMVNGINMKFE